MELVVDSGAEVSNLEECNSSKEREIRSVALEKTYVHEVYTQISSQNTASNNNSKSRVWPRVKQFLIDLEPGSLVCDVGCGSGKYLGFNPYIYKIGLDRCSNLANIARDNAHEVLVSDNLRLPFRDECLDAVLSIAVIHHFATTDRRVEALRELTRVLRIGGRLIVSVWAMEQRHRKFESQDVLVPWSLPTMSSDDKTSSIERDLNSTTTSDDDATHYHAYTQTSDSDSFPSLSRDFRKRVRLRHRGRSIDPNCPSSSQSSSDLSSPNESCYTFVRRALQKLAGSKRSRGRRPWFLQGLDIPAHDEFIEPLNSMDEDGEEHLKHESSLEGALQLHNFDSSDFADFMKLNDPTQSAKQRTLILSNLLGQTRRRRTLETTRELRTSPLQIANQPKSKSLSDLFGLIPIGFLRSAKNRPPSEAKKPEKIPLLLNCPSIEIENFDGDLPNFLTYSEKEDYDVEFPDHMIHKAVQTDKSLSDSFQASFDSGFKIEEPVRNVRPMLVKQKHSISSPTNSFEMGLDSDKENMVKNNGDEEKGPTEANNSWGEIKTSVKNLPEFKQVSTLRVNTNPALWKQSSLNEDLIFCDRLKEKEKLKQNIQKQCSLNEEFISKERENNTKWDQMKEAFMNHSNVKCIQLLKNNISSRFRAASDSSQNYSSNSSTDNLSSLKTSPTPLQNSKSPTNSTSSIRNGLVRILQNWKQGESSGENSKNGSSENIFAARRGSKESSPRRGLFPPFFLRRASAGSLNTNKIDLSENSPLKLLSPPPYLNRRPSENELVAEARVGTKLLPGVRHVRKLSREDGSDSSKDSSFQSDTSVDSEDSFASVIFIPKVTEGESFSFNSDTRANSTDSDRSPKSPRLSPPNHIPKSPSPLASFDNFRREVSPTRGTVFTYSPESSSVKFVFDDSLLEENLKSIEKLQSLKTVLDETHPKIEIAEKIEKTVEKEVQLQPEITKKRKGDKIEVLRKPVNLPKNKAEITRKLVRRSLPKELAVDLYNPETDDADTSESSSSSPNSVSSVVSVENSAHLNLEKNSQNETSTSPQIQVEISKELETASEQEVTKNKDAENEGKKKTELAPTPPQNSSSSESLNSSISPKKNLHKYNLAQLGVTSEWLSSLPCDMILKLSDDTSSSSTQGLKRASSSDGSRRGERILLGEVKKIQQRGPEAKWPNCIIDESPPQSAKLIDEELAQAGMGVSQQPPEPVQEGQPESRPPSLHNDSKECLFDSIENLTTKTAPSRNPSIDSSMRMSSTCSCSLRGGDSFESWSSAKSSLTNSSSTHLTHNKSPLPPTGASSLGRSSERVVQRKRVVGSSSKSSSANGEDSEEAHLTFHRYYHVFREGELDKLIEKYVQNLHIISSYYDHANWCIVAEKVQVWTI